jgi:hypothetical protein
MSTSSRSAGQWAVTIVFALLSVAFLFRGVQLGLKWLRHVNEADLNFKAMTLWALLYVVVCAAIAVVAYSKPRASAN